MTTIKKSVARPARHTKRDRAIIMIKRGATTSAIVKALNITSSYVYNLRSKLKKEALSTMTVPSAQLKLNLEALDEISRKHQEHIKAHMDALHERSKTQSIQGEYGKHQQMSTWQRIKAAIGF
jgi:transposase